MRPLVLVADRDPFFLGLLEAAVHGSGCEVMVALEGNDALACVARYAPALVVVDAELPEVSGLEILSILRREPGLEGISVVLAGDSAGDGPQPDAYVVRPYRVVELQATIAKVLRRAREDRRRHREQRRSEIPSAHPLGNPSQLLLAIEHEVTQAVRYRRPMVCLVTSADVASSDALHDALRDALRASDMVFASPIAGEAVALLPDTDEQGGLVALDRLRVSLSAHAWIGLAVCPRDGENARSLLQLAREAARRSVRTPSEVATLKNNALSDAPSED